MLSTEVCGYGLDMWLRSRAENLKVIQCELKV